MFIYFTKEYNIYFTWEYKEYAWTSFLVKTADVSKKNSRRQQLIGITEKNKTK